MDKFRYMHSRCVIAACIHTRTHARITEDAEETHKQQNKTGLPVWCWVLSDDIHPQAFREHGVLTPTFIHNNHQIKKKKSNVCMNAVLVFPNFKNLQSFSNCIGNHQTVFLLLFFYRWLSLFLL